MVAYPVTVTGLRMAQKYLGFSDLGMCTIVGATLYEWQEWCSYKSPLLPGEHIIWKIELAEDLKNMKGE